MNPDPLVSLWNSTANQPLPAAGAQLAARFIRRRRRRRRFQAVWLAWTTLALTAVTALAATQFARQGTAAFAGQWALLPLLALPWWVTLRLLREFLRTGNAGATPLPFVAALRAARASNQAERRQLRLVGSLLAAMVPLLALAIRQLHLAGKATVDQAWSMALVFGSALTLSAAVITWRYCYRLRPERHAIDAQLRDLESPAAP